MNEDCLLCGRWAPDVKTGNDLPFAFLPDGQGGRYHIECVARDLLPALHNSPGARLALKAASAGVRAMYGDDGRLH